MLLSIIIPTYNEINNPYLYQTLKNLSQLDSKVTEVIIVDSSSTDGTNKLFCKYPVKVIKTLKTSRAARMNIGVKNANGKTIIIHHPRSLLDKSCIYDCLKVSKLGKKNYWGGFTLEHDYPHKFLRFVAWYSNQIRVKKKNTVYLDHCFFISSTLADKVFPLKDVDIFEDTILSQKLARYVKPRLLTGISLTSSIRFVKRGVFKQFFMNQFLKCLFTVGFSDSFMNRIYECNCHLNVKKI